MMCVYAIKSIQLCEALKKICVFFFFAMSNVEVQFSKTLCICSRYRKKVHNRIKYAMECFSFMNRIKFYCFTITLNDELTNDRKQQQKKLNKKCLSADLFISQFVFFIFLRTLNAHNKRSLQMRKVVKECSKLKFYSLILRSNRIIYNTFF